MKMKDYCSSMEEKYSEKIKVINNVLFSRGSQERGIWLYDVLHSRAWGVPAELKYYILKEWWTSIDKFHEKFPAKDIRKWIKSAKVELDFNNLTVGDDGFVKIYRGVNEYSRGWDGLSWTTDKRVALKFASGASVRGKCNYPEMLEAGVSLDFILGLFNSRQESEVLCEIIEQKGHYSVKELLDAEEKYNQAMEYIKEGKAEPDEEFNALRKRYRDLMIEFQFECELNDEIPC